MSFSKTEFDAVEKAIHSRRTFKVLRDPANPISFHRDDLESGRQRVRRAVAGADWAPFHYDRAADGVPQPWRVDILWHDVCQNVANHFYEWFADVKPGNKIPAMLSACGACVVVRWLPQFTSSGDSASLSDSASSDGSALPKTKQTEIDEEHLAAVSAYVQNLLLLLTAANMGTYWSSGGQFRSDLMKQKIGLADGKVLAAVFVEFPTEGLSNAEFPKTDSPDAESTHDTHNASAVQRLPGKLADRRAAASKWCREISTDVFIDAS